MGIVIPMSPFAKKVFQHRQAVPSSLIIWVALALIVRALGVRVVALPSFLTVERLLKNRILTPVANFSGRFLDLSVQFVKGSAICFSTVSQTLLVILLLVLSVGF